MACLVVWIPLATFLLDWAFAGHRGLFIRWLITASVGDTVCFLSFGGAILLRHVIDAIARRRGGPPSTLGLSFYFGVASLAMPCVLPIGLWVGVIVARMIGHSYHPNLGSYRFGIGFGAVTIALVFLYRSRVQANERVRDLENANLKAQLAALTAEMNPHMLFNALNTIASLVHDDPDRAEQTVLELAAVYRGTLQAASGKAHALADELRLCEAYLRVESARYGERLKIAVSIADGVDTRRVDVPVLLLQPLVENAVRHGISPRASGGRVTIGVGPAGESVEVIIDDDGIGLGNSPNGGNGRAVTNTVERLRLAFGDAGRLELTARTEGGTRARVLLPKGASR